MESNITEPSAPEQPGEAPPASIDLHARVGELERDLQRTRRTLRTAETLATIHRVLAGALPVDADAVAMIIEAAMTQGESAPDAAAVLRAIDDLRRARPALFRSPGSARTSTMPARVERPATHIEDAAAHAAKRGDRASLMQYLRLKRLR